MLESIVEKDLRQKAKNVRIRQSKTSRQSMVVDPLSRHDGPSPARAMPPPAKNS